MSQVDDLIGYLEWLAPRIRYDTSDAPTSAGIPARCDPEHSGVADCSGFTNAGLAHVGVATPRRCMVSGDFYQWCRASGTLMPLGAAIARRGSLLFRGWSGNEHIAVSLGNGFQIAAHGHFSNPQVGIASVGSFSGWTPFGGWPPGLSDITWPPIISKPPPPKVQPMYDPPIAASLGLSAVWQGSDGSVKAAVAPNGDVYAWSVPFRPWPNKDADFFGRTAATIGQANKLPRFHDLPDNRYVITATTGEQYAP